MPPGASHASKTGRPDAIPAASPVMPPPSIHVLAPRLVNLSSPFLRVSYPIKQLLSRTAQRRLRLLLSSLSHPNCQIHLHVVDSARIHNGLQSPAKLIIVSCAIFCASGQSREISGKFLPRFL